MDVSRFRVGDWVLVVAGATMLVLGLAVPWVTVELGGVDLGGARNAFDYPLTGGLAWLLVVAAAVVTFLRSAGLLGSDHLPLTRLCVGATVLAVVLMGLRVALGAGDDARAELGRGVGMIIALVAAIAALGGAVANLRAEGDSIGSLLPSRQEPASAEGPSTLPPPPSGA